MYGMHFMCMVGVSGSGSLFRVADRTGWAPSLAGHKTHLIIQ